jgi:chaperonin GroES
MKIRPLYDRVVVKRIGQQRTTASGIVIPDATRRSRSREKSLR